MTVETLEARARSMLASNGDLPRPSTKVVLVGMYDEACAVIELLLAERESLRSALSQIHNNDPESFEASIARAALRA